MDFRRIPFQFSSTDPAKRQAELQKRFGLPTKQDKMYIDLEKPGLMGARKESNSASSSPRLQHRVPIFVEGMSEKSCTDSNPTNVDAGQKPRARYERYVPIEITDSDASTRHRTLSGSTCVNDNPYHPRSWISNDMKAQQSWHPDDVNPKTDSTSFKSPKVPKVCNIPIKIEGDDKIKKAKVGTPEKKEPSPLKVTPVQKHNGCNVSKVGKSEGKKFPLSPVFQACLKKIDVVLEKLKAFQISVEEFSGTGKDKEYRYLDEMLTRLMLDLDNVETMGNEEVRLARKAAIKKVQNCIDLLESKVTENSLKQEHSAEILEAGKKSDVVETVPSHESDKTSDSSVVIPDIEMEDPSKKDSESAKAVCVDESTNGNSAVLGNETKSGTVEVQESQPMEGDETQTVLAPSDKLLSSQEQSMETDEAENATVIANKENESKNDYEVDNSKPSALTTVELSSDCVTLNECSTNDIEPVDAVQNVCEDISADCQLQSEPCQHPSVAAVDNKTTKELNDSKETVEDLLVTDSNLTVTDQPS